MAWLTVDKNSTETIMGLKGSRFVDDTWCSPSPHFIILPKGTIEKIIGRKLTWDDEPVEIRDIINHHEEFMEDKRKVEEIIKSIRESFVGADYVYTHGACLAFYKILKTIFPTAQAYITQDRDHIVTKIDDEFFDINGKTDGPFVWAYVDDVEMSGFNLWTTGIECPKCDEINTRDLEFYRFENERLKSKIAELTQEREKSCAGCMFEQYKYQYIPMPCRTCNRAAPDRYCGKQNDNN